MLKILYLAAHIAAQEHLIWGTMLRLRLPDCVCLTLESLLLPIHMLSLGKDIVLSWCLMLWISTMKSKDSIHLTVSGESMCTPFEESAIALENICMVADFPRYAPLCTLENGKTFPAWEQQWHLRKSAHSNHVKKLHNKDSPRKRLHDRQLNYIM